MPIAKVRTPDGKIARIDVPEGTTPAQVLEIAKNLPGAPEPKPPPVQPQLQQPRGVFDPAGYREGQLLETMRRQPNVETVKQAAQNIPESGGQFVKDIYSAVRHPVETAKGLASVTAGGIQQLIPGEQGNEQDFDAFIDIFRQRYGSPEQFRQTLIKDPVGTMADISSAFLAGGGALRAGGAAAKSSGLTSAGQGLSAAGLATDPVNIASRSATRAVGALTPEATPANMYESAAKFSTTLPEEQRGRMAQTALDEGIMPTGAGVEKTRGMIDNLNEQITAIIDNATETGKTIDQESLFQYLDEVRQDAILTGKPMSNLNAIDRVEKQIRTINQRLERGNLTPAQAQRLKQNIYKDVNYATGKEKVRFAEEAQKAVARAAKDELERLHPEIKALNAREGALIELLKSIERSASRISNRDLTGIGTPIKGTMGGAVAGAEGAAAGVIAGILDNPTVKSKLAIALNRARNKGLSVPGAPYRAAVFQGGRTQENERP